MARSLVPREESVVAVPGEFENILAAAADDRLGAYSRNLRASTPASPWARRRRRKSCAAL